MTDEELNALVEDLLDVAEGLAADDLTGLAAVCKNGASAIRQLMRERDEAHSNAADFLDQIALIRESADYHKSQAAMELHNQLVAERDEARKQAALFRSIIRA